MVDKRRSSEYKELRGFIPKSLTMEFKAASKKVGQNINETLEEAVKDWISKQEQSTERRSQNSFQEDLTFSSLPTISTAIEKTLDNPDWGLKHLAKETKISVSRLKKLLSGDRPTDEEIKKLAGYLVKLEGLVFDREELTDMRIAEELRQRQLERLKRGQRKPKD
ncbi:hypothetical protein [Pleurocapsa sp. FMAR1]|uniref:hypothetical protein n=1 Tax=Pleurocapsa sp. FMAR1 TaxID=3040204 RepID=UPI0029C7B089|nr:hypothetical protein [Pleurocapsa sp. FMAR1]